jgi:hypothetical protein
MKKKEKKPLRLAAEVVRTLDRGQLDRAAGGGSNANSCMPQCMFASRLCTE